MAFKLVEGRCGGWGERVERRSGFTKERMVIKY
jgi:hypothetical protein